MQNYVSQQNVVYTVSIFGQELTRQYAIHTHRHDIMIWVYAKTQLTSLLNGTEKTHKEKINIEFDVLNPCGSAFLLMLLAV